MPSPGKFQTSFVGTDILPARGGSGGRDKALGRKAYSGFVVPRELFYVVPAQHLSTGHCCVLNLALRQRYSIALGKPLLLLFSTKQRECAHLSELGARIWIPMEMDRKEAKKTPKTKPTKTNTEG